MLGIVLGPFTFSITITFLAVSAGLAITFPLALPFAWLLFMLVQGFGRFERSRFAALLDVDIPNPHAPLQWTQANLLVALHVMRRSLGHSHA